MLGRLMMTDDATGSGAENAVMAGIVPGNSTDGGADRSRQTKRWKRLWRWRPPAREERVVWHRADRLADRRGAAQRTARLLHAGRDARQLVLGDGQQLRAFAGPLLGEQRVLTDHQAFARIVGAGDLGYVAVSSRTTIRASTRSRRALRHAARQHGVECDAARGGRAQPARDRAAARGRFRLTEPTAGVQPRSQECVLVPLFGSLAVGTCSAQLGEYLPHCGKDEGMAHSEIDAPGRNPTILTTRMKRSFTVSPET
jgi:hypothetical protein